MTYDAKLAKVRALVEEHNDVLGKMSSVNNSPNLVNVDLTLSNIQAFGGTTEDRLRRFSFEDVESCIRLVDKPAYAGDAEAQQKFDALWDNRIVPKMLAKSIAEVFREGSTEIKETTETYVGDKKARRMSHKDLVQAYDPLEPNSAVAKRLKEISCGLAFIVFDTGRKINVDITLMLLEEVKQYKTARAKIKVENQWKPVYNIGFVPDNFADENPIYHGRPLLTDGMCDQIWRSWEGISLKAKQLVYIAVEIGSVKPNVDKAHDILDMLLEPNGENKFINRFAEASLEWDKLNDLGNLPTLKVPIGNNLPNNSNPTCGGLDKGKQVVPYRFSHEAAMERAASIRVSGKKKV